MIFKIHLLLILLLPITAPGSPIKRNSDAQIIKRLKLVSAEQIADAYDTLGIKNKVINRSSSHIKPSSHIQQVSGKAYTVLFSDISDTRPAIGTHTRDYLEAVPAGSIVMINNTAGNDFSVWGGLLSLYAAKHGILGVITNGSVRDIDVIKKSHFPVFSTGSTCNRGNGRYKVVELQKTISIDGVKINPGDYVLATSSGIIIIEPENAEKVITLAEKNRENEKRIAGLINSGYSLSKIDNMMSSN